ncbi:ATP-binding cassette domain-containing protein [Microbacterium sp.]|uniref:ABC transporter ATP-binding protein n=1 Tax=Microbacterium sp. TaxID=51671 RepID=UPI00373672AA
MIIADNAHVSYRVFASGKRMSSRDTLLSARALRGGRGQVTVPAVRGVTFTASEGETIGVVGHNGSGKSTLFRAMSGLIPTSEGAIWAADRPVLLGVNAALVPELSGENNIKLGLLAMGFSPEEAAAQVGSIADFAELNEFLYHPMRTYSSGMGARLRFAIASARAHSILLIDEALAVGDRRFKLKSEQRIRELRENAGLVMIVSHSAGSLRDTCDRVLWIHKGELRADGDAKEVIADYVRWTKQPGGGAVGAAVAAKPSQKLPAGKPTASESRPVIAGGAEGSPVATSGRSNNDAPSLLEEFLATATVDVVSPRVLSRAALRRDDYRRSVQRQHRRRIIALAITGAVILIAAAAGAAIAFLTAIPASPAGAPVSQSLGEDTAPGGDEVPVSNVAGDPASDVVAEFASAQPVASCTSESGEEAVELSWTVVGASVVALGGAAVEVDAIEQPLYAEVPVATDSFVVAYPCSEQTWTYTLTAEMPGGDRVSDTLQVSRDLAAQAPSVDAPPSSRASEAPSPDESIPSPAPSVPASSPTPAPAPTPAPSEPTTSPTPPADPTPSPTEAPEVEDPEPTPTIDITLPIDPIAPTS